MNRRELREKVDRLEQRLGWLQSHKPPAGKQVHIIKENDVWTFGVTEFEDGTFSSVWMALKGD